MIATSNRRSCIVGCLAAIVLASTGLPNTALAQDLTALFPHRAAVLPGEHAPQPGELVRLPLDAEILSRLRSDLGDLRVVAGGDMLPMALLAAPAPSGAGAATATLRQTVRPAVVGVQQQRQDREDGPSLWQESYELRIERYRDLDPAAEPSPWELVFATGATRFVRNVDVLLRHDGRSTPLLRGAPLFRLQNPSRQVDRLILGGLATDLPEGAVLEVEVQGEGDGYLEPVFTLQRSSTVEGSAPRRLPLPVTGTRRHDQTTIVTFELPPGFPTESIEIETSTSIFQRHASVWDPERNALLGSTTVQRAPHLTRRRERRHIALASATGPGRLELHLEDGNDPPLEQLQLWASVRHLDLLFTWPGDVEVTLLLGGGRAIPVHHDLQRLLGTGALATAEQPTDAPATVLPASGPHALRLTSLWTGSGIPEVRRDSLHDNPTWDQLPALAFAHRAGAVLDPGLFSHQRDFEIAATAEGVQRLRLGPAAMAVLRDDLGDARIVDKANQQWPYLVAPRRRSELTPIGIEAAPDEEGGTVYSLELEPAGATFEGIEIDFEQPYFDRAFELRARSGEREWQLLSGRLQRNPATTRRPSRLAFTATRLDALELRVHDGDDAPLQPIGAQARGLHRSLLLTAPAGHYRMLLGAPELPAPVYELERVRNLVLAVEAAEDPGGGNVASNPDQRWSWGFSRSHLERLAVWLGLGLAVAVLSWITVRSLREAPTQER